MCSLHIACDGFRPQWQSLVPEIDSLWLAKPKIPALWPYVEKVHQPLPMRNQLKILISETQINNSY